MTHVWVMRWRERQMKKWISANQVLAEEMYNYIYRESGHGIAPTVVDNVALLLADKRIEAVEKERDEWRAKAIDINGKHNTLQTENAALRSANRDLSNGAARLQETNRRLHADLTRIRERLAAARQTP